jgi:DNA-binding transcriptional regulator YdaS (Cro superfamily)
MRSPLKIWIALASADEQQVLAERVGTSRATLYQYANGHRQCSAERAGEIERVTAEMARASKGRLPRLYRTDLADACAQCDYARKCLGPRVEGLTEVAA